MIKLTVKIEGMVCGMCEAHINEAVRNAFPVKKVTSSHTRKQTVIIAEKGIPEQELKNVIVKAGYDAVSVSSEPYKKKGLFSVFKG
ncbi:MAG: heavy-metal-associated domain-containing protein [Lachnospiraceae bacterium]|nr:heavy-metal-associated domain-containing protein [Lachnospiraceae bacterium]